MNLHGDTIVYFQCLKLTPRRCLYLMFSLVFAQQESVYIASYIDGFKGLYEEERFRGKRHGPHSPLTADKTL
jgi:hypothetical protein